jgi:hypothetical protein
MKVATIQTPPSTRDESAAITSRIYAHAIEALREDAAARIDALLGGAVSSALAKPLVGPDLGVTLRQAQGDTGSAGVGESVPQRRHAPSSQTKNARRFVRFVVAPTGIESDTVEQPESTEDDNNGRS